MDKKQALYAYCLRLGDNSLILGQRLAEWCGHGPILEEDVAMTNIALDLIGQAKEFYEYAAEVEGKGRTEDDLAFLRSEREYYNSLLVEQPNGDFGYTMVRQLYNDAFTLPFYEALASSKDERIAAIAAKSLKEITYHLRHSSEWVIRLGDGTAESHDRVQQAVDGLWMFTGELFEMNQVDAALLKEGIAVDLIALKPKWEQAVEEVIERATLTLPDRNVWMTRGSRNGVHTEHLGHLLTEMQYLQRAFPGAKW